MPEVHDDERLAAVMRAGLAARAESAPDRLAGPFPTPLRTNRRRPLLAAAAAVVVALGVGVVVLTTRGGEDAAPPADRSSPPASVVSSAAPAPVPSDWRLESYAGVEVRVPPTWGWGVVPDHGYDCGQLRAAVRADGTRSTAVDVPYVGRPGMTSDACIRFDAGSSHPAGDAVWLGSPLDPGTVRYSDGTVSETVGAAGTRVTVFSADPSLLAQVLGTLATVVGPTDDNGCPLDPPASDWPTAAPDGLQPTSLSICLYDTILGGYTTLVWSGRQDADTAVAYLDAFARASAGYDPSRLVGAARAGQWIAVGVQGRVGGAAATRWDTVNFGAGQILSDRTGVGRVAAPLEQATVEPWAGPEHALRAIAIGPWGADPSVERFFRGMLG